MSETDQTTPEWKAREDQRAIERVAKATGEDPEFVREQIVAIITSFVGLPGVVGAPLIMGPEYYFEIACHQFECGMRVTADPVKEYRAPTDIGGTGNWVYLADDDGDLAQAAEDRFKDLAAAEYRAYRAALQERRAQRKK